MDVRIATGTSDTEDGGVPKGAALRRYARAILEEGDDLVPAREALIEALDAEATVQAASIVACFDGINRVADAAGIRLDGPADAPAAAQLIAALGMEEMSAARS